VHLAWRVSAEEPDVWAVAAGIGRSDLLERRAEKKVEELGAMKNRMSDLRNHLFETLEQLKDKDAPMDLERAKAISEVAQTLINSAKVEVELIKAIGSDATGGEFFGPQAKLIPRGSTAEGGPRMIAAQRSNG
jgi:hypothetical protein